MRKIHWAPIGHAVLILRVFEQERQAQAIFVFYRGPLTAVGLYTLSEAAGSDHSSVAAEFVINLTQEK